MDTNLRVYSVTWGSDVRKLFAADSMRELLERLLLLPEIPERYLQIGIEGKLE